MEDKTILFEEYHSELTAVRCCVLDSSLQVVEEEDWSVYITHRESVVVDTVNESSESNVSSIKLKDKAKKKARQRELVEGKCPRAKSVILKKFKERLLWEI